ncbi:MAG TPA: divalent metal cation transporter [Chloroflexota bacterium]|jgi:NRAMP (natural resistance-associated macrophage protein)-like metal ion transporter|nr:divalent metal cation transporter [Chloroflexota bacterium]
MVQSPLVGVAGARATALAREFNPLKRFWKLLGPGLVTGASDDDPSGIGTYAAAGAALGYAPLWTALVTFPLMAAVQFTCAKIGLVTGRGLASVLRAHYPRPLVYAAVGALALANAINAGADIGAIAAAIDLLVPVPAPVLVVLVAALVLALQLGGSYRVVAGVLKWLALALLVYLGAALLAQPDVGAVLRGTFLPTIQGDSGFLATLVAILGTTITPYMFFWQASHEAEEQGRVALKEHPAACEAELTYAAWDVNAGMLFSNLAMYFIMLASAATLFQAGQHDIQSAAQAAEALRPLAGDAATVLLALGLIGTGLLAVPVLTGSAAYAVAEALGWRNGLDAAPQQARGFYAVVAAATLCGLAINFLGINPIAALVWTAVLNGVLAGPLLLLILLVANNRAVMGRYVNGWATNLLVGAAAVALCAAAAALVASLAGGA